MQLGQESPLATPFLSSQSDTTNATVHSIKTSSQDQDKLGDLGGGDRRAENFDGDGKVEVHDDVNKAVQSTSSDFKTKVGIHSVPHQRHGGQVVDFV